MISIAQICRYPVKGLTAQNLDSVVLTAAEGIPGDRKYAIAHGSTRFDGGSPTWLSKDYFLMLMRNERLAQIKSTYDEATRVLTIQRDGKQVARGDLSQPLGRQLIEQFLSAYLSEESRGAPRIVSAPDVSFTDTREAFVSIINLASVADIERVVRASVDPMRFRGNLYLEGLPAWEEMRWPERHICVGDVVLDVVEPIGRCAATNVDPTSGERDLNIPKSLKSGFGHVDCGIYATVATGGLLNVGDEVMIT